MLLIHRCKGIVFMWNYVQKRRRREKVRCCNSIFYRQVDDSTFYMRGWSSTGLPYRPLTIPVYFAKEEKRTVVTTVQDKGVIKRYRAVCLLILMLPVSIGASLYTQILVAIRLVQRREGGCDYRQKSSSLVLSADKGGCDGEIALYFPWICSCVRSHCKPYPRIGGVRAK